MNEAQAQINLEVLCARIMDLSCSYTDVGQVDVAHSFGNLVEDLIDGAGYDYDQFIATRRLIATAV